MDRNDQILLGALAIGVTGVVMCAFNGLTNGQTIAAWVQAFGVFAAVYLSAHVASSHAERRERARTRQQVQSVSAAVSGVMQGVGFMLIAIDDTDQDLYRKGKAMMFEAIDLLTPARIHELPDSGLTFLALTVRSCVAEMESHLTVLQIQPVSLVMQDARLDQMLRGTKSACDMFLRDVQKGWWGSIEVW